LYWWEQQENEDLSDWRKNYMRTLELRTMNTRRMLRVNVQEDIQKATAQVE
jgi:hypothetical protein